MNKINIGLTVVIIFVILFIGANIYYDMANELEEHPEIKEVGGPPCITDLRLVIIMVSVALVFCIIALKMNKVENNEKN